MKLRINDPVKFRDSIARVIYVYDDDFYDVQMSELKVIYEKIPINELKLIIE